MMGSDTNKGGDNVKLDWWFFYNQPDVIIPTLKVSYCTSL